MREWRDSSWYDPVSQWRGDEGPPAVRSTLSPAAPAPLRPAPAPRRHPGVLVPAAPATGAQRPEPAAAGLRPAAARARLPGDPALERAGQGPTARRSQPRVRRDAARLLPQPRAGRAGPLPPQRDRPAADRGRALPARPGLVTSAPSGG